MPRLAVLFVLSAASSPCPDLNLIHYISVKSRHTRTPAPLIATLRTPRKQQRHQRIDFIRIYLQSHLPLHKNGTLK
ncbi:hypothetical protein NEILACOT_03509 [Neisseria lactamica ATCC 23970]|uniref:Uncharacterized protein n=2 Tax=Neisseria lactamica TaxID=486 RepID=D0W7K9_NEILA|nr:hypothetical protein B2G52_09055 [Neisseria lactamica]EEZ76394.1 hypothetical protein NEILACOT_03509 [Neisseria lactamica ATCC 23970]